MKSKPCPTCGGKIRIYYDNEIGDEVYCEDCEREFVLTSFNPIRLEPIEAYEEYDDYHFDEDD